MKYTIDKKEPYSLFELLEEKLDSLIAPQLKTEFITLQTEGVKNIILNMDQVHYADSSGLSAILTAHRLCKDSGGIMVMACVSDQVMKLINISKLDTVLDILPTVEEAVDAVFMHEVEAGLKTESSE